MNVVKRIGKLAGILAVVAAMAFGLAAAFGAEGDVPAHNKTLKDNGDGTYQLALDVTGDAEKKPSKANVIVVFDTSSSMNTATGNTEVTYTPTQSNGGWNYQNNLYGLIDGEYRQLTRTNSGTWQNPQYHFWYNGQEYTGQRYSRQEANQTRLQAAEDAVNELAAALLDYNGKDGNPEDTIEMALVDFANMAEIAQGPTTDYSAFEAVVNSRDAGNNNRGTNWEAGLRETLNVDFDDEDPTYVIFVSDGNPTFYLQDPQNTQRGGSGQETNNNVATSYEQAQPAAKAIVDEGYEFYTVGIYGNVDRMQGLTTSAGAPASNYYSAEDTAALQDALAEILAKIEMTGIGNVEIDDGTTNQVVTSSGTFELLEVDETSYRYWRAGGDYGTDNDGLGTEWTDSDTPAPPAAELVDGTVEWDLSGLGGTGILENGVKYTVTFDVYPSQTSYDIIAQLKNGDLTYGDTTKYPQEVWNNIVDNGGGSYSIRTNTTATLNYDDTRTEEPEKPVGYINPNPVATDAETLTINKTWEGGDPDVESLKMTVLMDNKKFHESTLSTSNSWKDSSFISIGIIKGDNVLQGAEGHDFTFAELDNTQYHWELDAPTVHPMLIDGKLKMLVKVDDKHPASGKTYTINGATYYVDEATTGLTAVNHRRSNLNLKKIVTGEDAPENATFPFTLTVNNSKANDPASTDTNSDNFVWFSIYDTKAGATVTDATVSGVAGGPNADGYYWAKSGANISVAMKDGWNLRFTNLPSGTTYTFTERTLADGFVFKESNLTEGKDTTFKDGQTTTGTIQETKTSYQVEYTNDYQLTDLEITKVWDDANDQDGLRLTPTELAEKLTLSPAVEGATPTVTKKDDNTYTIKYEGLPRFNNGTEVTYTVTESAIDGYTTEGSPANDHGTITNTHEPEVINITVNKTWIGPEAEDGAEVTLKADGTAVSGDGITNPVILSSSNNNAYTWEDLPKYADGEKIKYTVEEKAIDGFTTTGPTGTGTEDDPFVFTNTNDKTTKVYVKKVWVGPASTATINLLADGEAVDSIALPNQGSNEYAFEDLRMYDATTGEEIEYTVTEDAIDGYTTTGPTGSGTEASPYTFTNTNDAKVAVYVEKAWDDDNDRDGVRPESVTVHLKANGADVTQEGITAEKNLTGDDWADSWTGLYKYDQTTGEEITYTVTEDAVTGYTPKDGDPAGTGTEADPYVFTNSYKPGKTSVTVTKAWEDNGDQDGIRPDSVEVTLLADGKAVTQTGITAKVELSEDNSWTYTWTNLNEKEAGTAIEYTVAETTDEIITGTDGPGTYKYEVTGDATEGYTVTNTHTPETVEASVKKVWDDADNQDGKRPDELTVTLSDGKTATLNAENKWEAKVSGLPKYKDGEEIEYTWTEEDLPEGYTMTSNEAEGTVTTITNQHVPEEVEVSVKKVWEDANNQDGKRPESLTVTLSNGKTATLNAENKWEAKVSGLPKYKDGEEIEYTWTEEDLPEGYTMTSNETEGLVTTITNSYTPEETEATVKKVWDDADNQDGKRPGSLTVTLSNGDSVVLSEDNNWTETIDKLPKYKDGEEIEYTWTEAGLPDGYALSDTSTSGTVTTLTNKHEPEKVDVSVKKVWDDADDSSLRPDSLTVKLSNGDSVTLNEGNNWSATIEGLPKYKDGSVISYTWDETDLPDCYEMVSNTAEGYVTTITNKKLAPTSVQFSGTKTLKGRTLKNGEFEFLLKKGDEVIDSTTNAADGSFAFDEITYNDVGTYTYTIVENNDKLPKGVKENTQSYEVTVKVTAGTEGSLVATISGLNEDGSGANFLNVYKASPTKIIIAGQKVVKDSVDGTQLPLEGGEFTFTLNGTGEVEAVEEEAENSDANTKKNAEDAVEQPAEEANDDEAQAEVDEAKADALAAQEVAEEKAEEAKEAAEEAKEAADKAEEKAEEAKDAEQVEAPAKKAVESVAQVAAKAATETIVAPGSGNTAKNAADGTVTFEEIEFTRAGTYTYEISESGSMPGVTNEEGTKKVVVKVTDDEEGQLVAEIIEPEGGSTPHFTFNNVYKTPPTDSSITDTIPVTKELAGHSLAAGDFTFVLEDSTGKTVATAKNAADGTVKFPAITFIQKGTYTFKVKEKASDSSVITSDTSVYTAKAIVTNNYDGNELQIEWVYEDGNQITFKNTWSDVVYIDPPVQKVIEGSAPKNAETYTFKLEAQDPSNPMPKAANGQSSMTMSIKGAGTKEFGEIPYTEPGTYTYTVTEVPGSNPDCEYDGSVYTVTAVVTEDSNYKLHVKSTYKKDGQSIDTATFRFVNTYEEEEEGEGTNTGDRNNLLASMLLLTLSGMGICGTVLYRRRKEEN